jgi:hypothetical protein
VVESRGAGFREARLKAAARGASGRPRIMPGARLRRGSRAVIPPSGGRGEPAAKAARGLPSSIAAHEARFRRGPRTAGPTGKPAAGTRRQRASPPPSVQTAGIGPRATFGMAWPVRGELESSPSRYAKSAESTLLEVPAASIQQKGAARSDPNCSALSRTRLSVLKIPRDAADVGRPC